MNKKLSINMENDQVALIAVGGVQYTTSDEVFHLEDRATLDELLLMTNSLDSDPLNDHFEDNFESAFGPEFEKEMQGAQQRAAGIQMVIASILLFVALIMLAITAFSALQSFQTMAKEQLASGIALWILPSITGIIGLIIMTIALFILRARRKNLDEIDRSPKWD